jgi:hypothetical protein
VHLSLIRIVAISTFVLTLGSPVSKGHAQTHDSQVLFVCEHGNVKSLMAVSYFNQLAQERRLPFRAVSRGTAPDSTTVPPRDYSRPARRRFRREFVSSVSGQGFRHIRISARDHDWNCSAHGCTGRGSAQDRTVERCTTRQRRLRRGALFS